MSDIPVVSIVICTRDRAEHLRATLESFRRLHIPGDLPCELIVVDNGSLDDTPQIVQGFHLPQMPVRYVRETRGGKSAAYNRGLEAARGQIFLMTDDDLHPPVDWVEGMCRPIVTGEADAVAGGVALAPHLERDWMTLSHRHWLASTEELAGDARTTMVGANMAFSRRVLERVPGFDTELGGGGLGFAEDTLFSYQLRAAGYRFAARPEVKAIHHFDAARLTRESFMASARARGLSAAYMAYHWHHWNYGALPLRLALNLLKLGGLRLRRPGGEGLPEAEMLQRVTVWMLRGYLTERRRPRNYEKNGLVKRVQGKSE